MQVVVDDKLYHGVAGAFLRKFATTMVSTLNNANLLKSDVHNVADEDISLVFDICFFALSQLEDQNRFDFGKQKYAAHCMFATQPKEPEELLASWNRTALHGELHDAMIRDAIKDVLLADQGAGQHGKC